jgi:hypothetical protein
MSGMSVRALALAVTGLLALVCARGEASAQRPSDRGATQAYQTAISARTRQAPSVGEKYSRGHVVSFGMSDELDVFRKEATGGAAILSRHYGRGGQVVIRANTRSAAQATIGSLRSALVSVSGNMNRDNDILFVFLTSHGSQQGVAVTSGNDQSTLSPARLKSMLRETGARNKVVIVSACFSGIFADALADRRTLVVTAADATHPSFGCEPGAEWTWFGEALFVKGIPNSATFQAAFARARSEVRRKENYFCRVKRECNEPSNPQIRGGQDVLPFLRSLAQRSRFPGLCPGASSRAAI